MTNEEMERAIEFALKQRANFAEGVEQLRESHARAEKRISNQEIGLVNVTNALTDIAKSQLALAGRVTQSADSLEASIAGLRQSRAHTDQRLNALIDIIERRRNGESKG